MASDFLFTFTWHVPVSGFRFADACIKSSDGIPERVLVEQKESGLVEYRRYNPLAEEPGLFRDFADTPPSEEGILKFSNIWGALGEGDVITSPAPLTGGKGELFTAWVRAISDIRQAVWIWNRLTSPSREIQEELRHHVWWERDGAGNTHVIYDSHPHLPRTQSWTDDGYSRVLEIVASDQYGEEGLSQFQDNELAMPARAFLFRLANRNLQRRVSPRLAPGLMPVMKMKLPVRSSLQLAPSSLFACFWLQLAQVVSGEKTQRQCLGCREWFEATGKRTDKLYCDDACRKQAHQEKWLLALRLYAEGKPLKQIAAELGSTTQQVKKWVTTKKKG
jgi:hypothetical protein